MEGRGRRFASRKSRKPEKVLHGYNTIPLTFALRSRAPRTVLRVDAGWLGVEWSGMSWGLVSYNTYLIGTVYLRYSATG
jgi:hypothetical protein